MAEVIQELPFIIACFFLFAAMGLIYWVLKEINELLRMVLQIVKREPDA